VSISDSESELPDGEGFLEGHEGTSADASGVSGATDPSSQHRIHSPEDLDFGDDFNLDLLNSTRPKRHTKKKRAYSHTYGRCGTPDYLSPEIILNEPHGPPVDFWALGVILYEMLVGFPPFNDETVEAIFNNILERQILWPDGDKCLSNEAMDLINLLLEPDTSKRLGWEGIQRHAFFRGIDWDTLLDSTPPFVPTLEGPNDTSYFNNRNLTDIFIDDEEFDFDTQSVDSSMVEQQSESSALEDATSTSAGGIPSSTEEDEQLMNALGALVGAQPSVRTTALDSKIARDSSFKTDQDPTFAMSEPASTVDTDRVENNLKFPSGMYSGPRDEADMNEAFRSFSFTNMNALAAASRNEAELIADTRLSEVENSSSLTILI
jgi:serine/threonine protein kinase